MAPLARLALVAAYLAAFAVGAPTSNSLALDEDKPNCHSGVYMVVTRGSEEPPGEGRCAEVAQIVKAALPNAASTAVPYPATTANPPYNDSVVKGIKSLKHIVESYVDHCGPKSRVALVGYSQGGQVSTDALVGGDTPAALDQKYHKHSMFPCTGETSFIERLTNCSCPVTAVTVFGDPTFTAGEPFDRGNATTSGVSMVINSKKTLLILY